jgi:hypothetical protein
VAFEPPWDLGPCQRCPIQKDVAVATPADGIKSSAYSTRPSGASSIAGGCVEVDPPDLVRVPSVLRFSVMVVSFVLCSLGI